MSLLAVAGANSAVAAGYDIDNSLKLESDNTEYLTYTPSSTTNVKTWTFSCWAKRTELYNGSNSQHLFGHFTDGSNHTAFRFDDADVLELRNVVTGTTYELKTDQVFRDTSAWYHIVIAFDTTQSTAADRTKVYVNGNQVTLSGTYTALNQITYINTSGDAMGVGTLAGFGNHFNGYMAEIHHIDGQQLAASDFGETDSDTGIWKPKEYTGTYGSNGFYLDFEDSGSLGADDSGNGNNFTLNNITSADQATDTPTNNFCTLNPLVNFKYTTNGITEGGTEFGDNTGGGVGGAFGTMAVTAGKWYWEVKLTQQSSHYIGVSVVDDGDNVLASTDPQQENSTFRFNISAARIEYFDGGTNTNGSNDAFTDFHSVGDIIGIALNMDDNQISIYGNGTLQSSVANTSLYDAANKMVVPFHGTIDDECQYNFGGYSAWTPSSAASDSNGHGVFEFEPPSNYLALCSKNLGSDGG